MCGMLDQVHLVDEPNTGGVASEIAGKGAQASGAACRSVRNSARLPVHIWSLARWWIVL